MVSRPITATGVNVGTSWSEQGTSIRMDSMSLVIALLLHAPLYFVKVNAHKKQIDSKSERLISVDLIDTLKKEEPAPLPPPAPKADSIRERLLKLVRKEPPPPAPPVEKKPIEQKLADAPNKIAIQPKLDLADKLAPKLQSKTGFETKADAKLVEQQQKMLAMNVAPAGIAPISAKRVGVIEDRSSLKSDKGKFAVGSKEVRDIGGDSGPSLAGAAVAPTLSIHTAGRGSVEKFSAAPVQKSDKGRIGGVAVPNVGGVPQLGLRDAIIARDAAPGQIATGKPGGAVGGVPGGVPGASKRDAGRFGGSEGGVVGGVVGGKGHVLGGTGTSTIATGGVAAPTRVREKKSMFTITGELSNRRIVKQVTPVYPAWAQAQGVEASVVLEFTVDAPGDVKPNIVVRRTTGYPKLDEVAIRALRDWKFAPLPVGSENREEVGLITFNFTLS